MIITITGTPGVGKTYIAKRLAGKNFEYFDLNKYIKEKKLFDNYDKKAKTYDVNVKKIKNSDYIFEKNLGVKSNGLKKLLKLFGNKTKNEKTTIKKIKFTELKKLLQKEEGVIIDSHLSHYLKSDLCIVVKSDIKKIRMQLNERKYSKNKIEDNIQSEIFDICLEEARKEKNNVIILEN